MPEQWYWDTFYWIFVIFTEIFENGSLIYRNGGAANRLYKRFFSATGGRITCMIHVFCIEITKNSCGNRFQSNLVIRLVPVNLCTAVKPKYDYHY